MHIPLNSALAWLLGTIVYIGASTVSLFLPTSSKLYHNIIVPHNYHFLHWNFYIAVLPCMYNLFTWGVILDMVYRLSLIPQKNISAVIGLTTGYSSAFCIIQTLFWVMTKRTHLSVLLGSVKYESGLTLHTTFGHFAVILGFIHGYFEVRKQRPHIYVGKVTITGSIAMCAFLLGYVPAFQCFRQKYYDVFRFFHLFMILGTVLVFAHLYIHPRATLSHQKSPGYIIGLLTLVFFIDRIINVIKAKIFTLQIESAKYHKTPTKSGDKYHLLLQLKCTSNKQVIAPGNWILTNIPRIGLIPHPFSVFGVKENMNINDENETEKKEKFQSFCLLIGVYPPRSFYTPWTYRLYKLISTKNTTPLTFMTGPYGCLRTPEKIVSADYVLVLCGGTGISTCLANLAYIPSKKLLNFYWSFREPIVYCWLKDYFNKFSKERLHFYCTYNMSDAEMSEYDGSCLDQVQASRMNIKEIIKSNFNYLKNLSILNETEALNEVSSELIGNAINSSRTTTHHHKKIKLLIFAAVPKSLLKVIEHSIAYAKKEYKKYLQITYEPQVYSF